MREMSQQEWRVLVRDLGRFYGAALFVVGVGAFLLGCLVGR